MDEEQGLEDSLEGLISNKHELEELKAKRDDIERRIRGVEEARQRLEKDLAPCVSKDNPKRHFAVGSTLVIAHWFRDDSISFQIHDLEIMT